MLLVRIVGEIVQFPRFAVVAEQFPISVPNGLAIAIAPPNDVERATFRVRRFTGDAYPDLRRDIADVAFRAEASRANTRHRWIGMAMGMLT
mgnify:CR=1 FL=1